MAATPKPKSPMEAHGKDQNLRQRLHEIIFEADTAAGKFFDVALIAAIALSVLAVMLDSVASINASHGSFLIAVEWFFTILFSLEYLLRLYTVHRSLSYAFSFFGIVDLLATLPTWLSLLFPGTHYLLIIRILRVLRIFRIFKLAQYLGEAKKLSNALRASRRKIIIFLFVVVVMTVIFGSVMYLVEGASNGFTSIPRSIYWAIVTMTTVGYGDISPQTPLGQTLASLIMIMGYGIIAVPTGIVTAELGRQTPLKVSTQSCPNCSEEGHEYDARFCKSCGCKL